MSAHRRFVRLVLSVEDGFDGLGVVVVPCVNDGTSVTLAETPPAPEPGDVLHYDAMVNRISDKFLMSPVPGRGGFASESRRRGSATGDFSLGQRPNQAIDLPLFSKVEVPYGAPSPEQLYVVVAMCCPPVPMSSIAMAEMLASGFEQGEVRPRLVPASAARYATSGRAWPRPRMPAPQVKRGSPARAHSQVGEGVRVVFASRSPRRAR